MSNYRDYLTNDPTPKHYRPGPPSPPTPVANPALQTPPPGPTLGEALKSLATTYGGGSMVLAAARSLFGQKGKVSAAHPQTSHDAARLQFGSQRFRVLRTIKAAGVVGATAAEVAAVHSLSRNQTATRLMELREWGFIEYRADNRGNPIKRATGPKAEGLVQFITQAGREAVRFANEEETNANRTP